VIRLDFFGPDDLLVDDYLDAFGDPEKFGKQVGGDILANKKIGKVFADYILKSI
jgi:hypothetical protein